MAQKIVITYKYPNFQTGYDFAQKLTDDGFDVTIESTGYNTICLTAIKDGAVEVSENTQELQVLLG